MATRKNLDEAKQMARDATAAVLRKMASEVAKGAK